jgi:hypothetical protein
MSKFQTEFQRFTQDGCKVQYDVTYSLDMEGIVIHEVSRNLMRLEYTPDVWMDAMDAAAMHYSEIEEDELEFGLANEEW